MTEFLNRFKERRQRRLLIIGTSAVVATGTTLGLVAANVGGDTNINTGVVYQKIDHPSQIKLIKIGNGLYSIPIPESWEIDFRSCDVKGVCRTGSKNVSYEVFKRTKIGQTVTASPNS